jgi:hypothetical protein
MNFGGICSNGAVIQFMQIFERTENYFSINSSLVSEVLLELSLSAQNCYNVIIPILT